jgi:hypothetical protein
VQCILPQGQTTPEKTLSNPWHGKGFCEANQYKSAINRCEGGYKSCDLGIDMFKRLAKITEHYSEAIREWSASSQRQIAESNECGTTKKAWLQSVRAVEKVAEQNDFIVEGIQEKVVDKMTAYKNENYGKSFIHVKKIKEFEKDFKKIQKPWLEFLEKLNAAKQAFHDAQRKLNHAVGAEEIIKTDVGSSDEQKKKAKTSVDNRRVDTNTCKATYQRLISEMKTRKETYQEDMFKVLKCTDEFEIKRLKHFNSTFTALKESILIQKTEHRTKMDEAFTQAIKEQNIDEDIEFFNLHYGSKTVTKWPDFEDLKE